MEKLMKLRNKKGFTLIELIVVIAIIGILLALIIPNLSTSDKPSAGKSYAKDFYYKSQSFFSRKKLVNNAAITGDTIFYFDISQNGLTMTDIDSNGDGAYDATGVDPNTYGIASGSTQTACSSVGDAGLKTLLQDYAREMSKDIVNTAYDGTLYVMVDDGYRVKVTYWTDGGIADLNGSIFQSECLLNSGFYACAYPPRLSSPEGGTQIMFQYT